LGRGPVCPRVDPGRGRLSSDPRGQPCSDLGGRLHARARRLRWRWSRPCVAVRPDYNAARAGLKRVKRELACARPASTCRGCGPERVRKRARAMRRWPRAACSHPRPKNRQFVGARRFLSLLFRRPIQCFQMNGTTVEFLSPQIVNRITNFQTIDTLSLSCPPSSTPGAEIPVGREGSRWMERRFGGGRQGTHPRRPRGMPGERDVAPRVDGTEVGRRRPRSMPSTTTGYAR